MKKLLILTIISLLFCQLKVRSQTAFPDSDSLVNYLSGTWTWYRSCGGLNGGCTYATQLSTQKFIFTRISTTADSIAFKYYKNSALTSQGRIGLSYGSSIFGVTWNMSQVQNFSASSIAIPYANADSVTFADNCNDCYNHIFVRGTGSAPTVGLHNITNSARPLNVFPSPCMNEVNISTPGDPSEITGIFIYDLTGKKTVAVSIQKNVVDVSALLPGVYFIEVKTGNTTYRNKLIKE